MKKSKAPRMGLMKMVKSWPCIPEFISKASFKKQNKTKQKPRMTAAPI